VIDRRRIAMVLVSAWSIAACGTAAPSTSGATDPIATTAAPSTAVAPAPTSPPNLPSGVSLDPGTYRLLPSVVGARFPSIDITVPSGWSGGGWLLNRPRTGHDIPPIAIQFWDVDRIFGHPCQWQGTLRDPGPTVDDLAAALALVPMRAATTPSDVTLDGASGKYLEWSVPADLTVEANSNFPDCDTTGEGMHDFVSWTGLGAASSRYHQAPGQVDYVWILDVDGSRLVIDAFSMPYATEAELAELRTVVQSIRFGA
jgi:hypothetical protein